MLFNVDIWKSGIPSNDTPARIMMVIIERSSMMEFSDNPMAGIDVKADENLDKKHTIQMMPQLIRKGKGINLELLKEDTVPLSSHTPFNSTVPLGQLITQDPPYRYLPAWQLVQLEVDPWHQRQVLTQLTQLLLIFT